MRYLRAIIIWLVVIAAGYFAVRFLWPLFTAEEEETDIQTIAVQRDDLRSAVPADGTVVPVVRVEVKSKASGVVESVNAEEGDEVSAGDVLVELDKEQIQARLRQADADLTVATAQLKIIERNLTPQQLVSRESAVKQAQISYDEALERYERIAELYGKGYATDEELSSAQAALEGAKESLDQAERQLELDLEGPEPEELEAARASVLRQEAEVDNMREELANTTIRAPISGTVLQRPVEVGTAVSSGTTGSTGGTVVVIIGDLSTMYVQARIDETELGKVELDAPCRITFDAYTGWLWLGRVIKIYPQGEEGQAGTQFPVDIAIDLASARPEGRGGGAGRGTPGRGGAGGTGGGSAGGGVVAVKPSGGVEEKPAEVTEETPRLWPPMTANVEIVLEDHPQVLILPAQYVRYDNGQPYCEVLPDPENLEERERRDLELGFTDGLRHEVISGLSEGETVVLERSIRQDSRFF